MAFRAGLDMDLGLRGTGRESIAAVASHFALNVLRMDVLFHFFTSFRMVSDHLKLKQSAL